VNLDFCVHLLASALCNLIDDLRSRWRVSVRLTANAAVVEGDVKELAFYREKLEKQVYEPNSIHVCVIVGREKRFLNRHSLRSKEELFQTLPEHPESCAWFNRLLVRIMMEYRCVVRSDCGNQRV
jgi:hypothetical protein